MARTSAFVNKVNLAVMLNDLDNLSPHYAKTLMAMGYINKETYRIPGSRGKLSVRFNLTGKGKGLVALSRNWKSVKEMGTPVMAISQAFIVDMPLHINHGYEVHIS